MLSSLQVWYALEADGNVTQHDVLVSIRDEEPTDGVEYLIDKVHKVDKVI